MKDYDLEILLKNYENLEKMSDFIIKQLNECKSSILGIYDRIHYDAIKNKSTSELFAYYIDPNYNSIQKKRDAENFFKKYQLHICVDCNEVQIWIDRGTLFGDHKPIMKSIETVIQYINPNEKGNRVINLSSYNPIFSLHYDGIYWSFIEQYNKTSYRVKYCDTSLEPVLFFIKKEFFDIKFLLG